MRLHKINWRVLAIAGVFMLGSTFLASAAEIGPGFDPSSASGTSQGASDNAISIGQAPPSQATDSSAPMDSGNASGGETGPGFGLPSGNRTDSLGTAAPETGSPSTESGTPSIGTGTGAGSQGILAPEDGTGSQDGSDQILLPEELINPDTEDGYPEGHPLSVPHRTPRIQTTLLITDPLGWSQAFINDQWCGVDNKPFVSLSIFLEEIHGNILYRTYTTSNGWTRWVLNGQQTTIPANMAPVEAFEVRFAGPVHNDYDIYYSALLSDGTYTGWAKNGTAAGAMGQNAYICGLRMVYAAKGTVPNLDFGTPSLFSAHADGIQYIDGMMRYIHGDGSNFTGWGWDDDKQYYFVDSLPVTGWQYIDGYKYYFAEDGHLLTDLEPIVGNGGPFRIRINKQMNCMTVFTTDGANGYIVPVKTFLTSCGDDTPLGTFHTPEKYRWRLMIHDLYTQYATRLGSGLHILIHSIIYDAPDPFTVWASTYNNLGIARSSGCIRLTTADSKWIYDYCPIGTAVEVYNSSIPGPYERPTIASEIPFEQNWDPTDPNITEDEIAQASAAISAKFGY